MKTRAELRLGCLELAMNALSQLRRADCQDTERVLRLASQLYQWVASDGEDPASISKQTDWWTGPEAAEILRQAGLD